MTLSTHLRRNLVRAATLLLVAAAAWGGWQVLRVWRAWQNVERVAFDVTDAREAMGQAAGDHSATTLPPAGEEVPTTLPPEVTVPDSPPLQPETRTFLIIGTDQRPGLGASSRADVILLFILPEHGADPLLVSVPRDLYLPNPCTGGLTRVNATLNGCGDRATGPELLAVTLEDFTGLQIDHFALFDFLGFQAIIDRVGGVEICVEHPVREPGNPFSLPAGCSLADGATTLAWMRSRHTQELVDGVWRTVPGVSDLTRNQRQQELLLEALARLKGFRSVTDFASLVEELSDTFTIDERLSLGAAISLAWDMRGIDVATIRRPVIPVSFYVTGGGAEVLRPEATFAEVLESAYPGAADILGGV